MARKKHELAKYFPEFLEGERVVVEDITSEPKIGEIVAPRTGIVRVCKAFFPDHPYCQTNKLIIKFDDSMSEYFYGNLIYHQGGDGNAPGCPFPAEKKDYRIKRLNSEELSNLEEIAQQEYGAIIELTSKSEYAQKIAVLKTLKALRGHLERK